MFRYSFAVSLNLASHFLALGGGIREDVQNSQHDKGLVAFTFDLDDKATCEAIFRVLEGGVKAEGKVAQRVMAALRLTLDMRRLQGNASIYVPNILPWRPSTLSSQDNVFNLTALPHMQITGLVAYLGKSNPDELSSMERGAWNLLNEYAFSRGLIKNTSEPIVENPASPVALALSSLSPPKKRIYEPIPRQLRFAGPRDSARSPSPSQFPSKPDAIGSLEGSVIKALDLNGGLLDIWDTLSLAAKKGLSYLLTEENTAPASLRAFLANPAIPLASQSVNGILEKMALLHEKGIRGSSYPFGIANGFKNSDRAKIRSFVQKMDRALEMADETEARISIFISQEPRINFQDTEIQFYRQKILPFMTAGVQDMLGRLTLDAIVETGKRSETRIVEVKDPIDDLQSPKMAMQLRQALRLALVAREKEWAGVEFVLTRPGASEAYKDAVAETFTLMGIKFIIRCGKEILRDGGLVPTFALKVEPEAPKKAAPPISKVPAPKKTAPAPVIATGAGFTLEARASFDTFLPAKGISAEQLSNFLKNEALDHLIPGGRNRVLESVHLLHERNVAGYEAGFLPRVSRNDERFTRSKQDVIDALWKTYTEAEVLSETMPVTIMPRLEFQWSDFTPKQKKYMEKEIWSRLPAEMKSHDDAEAVSTVTPELIVRRGNVDRIVVLKEAGEVGVTLKARTAIRLALAAQRKGLGGIEWVITGGVALEEHVRVLSQAFKVMGVPYQIREGERVLAEEGFAAPVIKRSSRRREGSAAQGEDAIGSRVNGSLKGTPSKGSGNVPRGLSERNYLSPFKGTHFGDGTLKAKEVPSPAESLPGWQRLQKVLIRQGYSLELLRHVKGGDRVKLLLLHGAHRHHEMNRLLARVAGWHSQGRTNGIFATSVGSSMSRTLSMTRVMR